MNKKVRKLIKLEKKLMQISQDLEKITQNTTSTELCTAIDHIDCIIEEFPLLITTLAKVKINDNKKGINSDG